MMESHAGILMDRRNTKNFDGATDVKPEKKGIRYKLVPLKAFKIQSGDYLVCLESSGDYYKYNNETNTLRTDGRECNTTSKAMDGCGSLYFGRGHKTKVDNRRK